MNHSQHEHHDHNDHHKMMMEDFKKRFWFSLLLTIPILFLSPLIAGLLNYASVIDFSGSTLLLWTLSTIVFLYGGKPFLKGLISETKSKNPGMMTLIAIAISVAYGYSTAVVFGLEGKLFFWELATLIDVMLLGHWIEMRSILGASKALQELTKLLPSSAHKVMGNNKTNDVEISSLVVGDRVLVKPGEMIPVDGVVISGTSYIDESLLTGETTPIEKKAKSNVIGGSINADGSITIEVKKIGKDTFLNQVIQLVQEAQSSQSKTQDLANKAARWLAVIGVSAGFVTLASWLTLSTESTAFAIERAVTVMVITCPHALGLAIPLVVSVSTTKAAKEGLLIRNRVAFERAKDIDVVVFDKTGTLTKGLFGVDKINVRNGYKEDDIKIWAASLESHSQHPIAQSISKISDKKLKVSKFKSLTALGVQGKIGKKDIKIVSPSYLDAHNVNAGKFDVKKISSVGQTTILVIVDNELAAYLQLSDVVREESITAVAELQQLGIKAYMLTGDNKHVAKKVAEQIGLDDFFAEVNPGGKSKKIKELQADGLVVAMVGDGVNDAPALAQADVGLAIGAGTDVAAETADMILVRNNPEGVATSIRFAKATYRKMLQNLAWATGYNVVAIPLAAGVFYGAGVVISPAAGAFFMSISTVVVAVNARYLKVEESS